VESLGLERLNLGVDEGHEMLQLVDKNYEPAKIH
jgi:hypothetical protein